MVKWKLFNRSKTKEEAHLEDKVATEEIQETKEKQGIPELKEEPKEIPIKEYNVTLYSKGSHQKQPTTALPGKKQPLKRISWENTEAIEHNIDSMKKDRKESRSAQKGEDTDKKVDYILLKKKK